MANSKVGYWFIGGTIAVGVGCYFLNKYMKEKAVSKLPAKSIAPSFNEERTERVESIDAEVIERPKEMPPQSRQLKDAEIIFNDSCRKVYEKRIGRSNGMTRDRKTRLTNCLNNLNCNPEFEAEKIKIYNAGMSRDDVDFMEKMIFDWCLSQSR